MTNRAAAFALTANWGLVFVMIGALWFGFRILFSIGFAVWSELPAAQQDPGLINIFLSGSTPAAVRWTLATFALYIVILLALMKTLHRLGLRALIGDVTLAWHQFLRVSRYLLPFYLLITVPPLFTPEPFQQMSVTSWLLLLPATLPLLFVQISAEELVFRGYLQSHLAALAQHPLIWMGIPSFLFGLIHYDPYSPAYTAWAYVIWATGLGLVCADLTARSGTLDPALAVHFLNNIFAILVVASDDWLYGASLYVWPTYGAPWEPWIPYEALVLLILWLTGRLALRR